MSKEIKTKEKKINDDTFSITMELERPLFIDDIIEEEKKIKKNEINKKIKNKVIKGLGIGIVIIVIAIAIWINKTYKPKDIAQSALVSNENIQVSVSDYISFTPKNVKSTKGFIFYPGAKVEYEAYAPICRAIAEQGYEVVILDMPLNIAFLGQNKAKQVIADYPEITSWAVGGHSLGGVVASNFASKNNMVDGVVLLASYPMNDNLKQIGKDVMSIWGSKDGVVNFKEIIKSKENLPQSTTYVEIEGANHSQFADYGLQKGDYEALISSDKQMEITYKNIVKFLENLN